jgi:hypothetical protein
MTLSLRALGLALLAFAVGSTSVQSASAQQPAPCVAPEFRQLDFWLGEWDLTWPAPGDSLGGKGTNRIEKILDGCVIQENFSGDGPRALVGHSVSTYSVQEKKWKQTWVDNQGGYLALTGELKDGEMILGRQGTGPDGKPLQARMVFFHIKPDSFDWCWEASTDGGKTWQVNWPIHYSRKGSPATTEAPNLAVPFPPEATVPAQAEIPGPAAPPTIPFKIVSLELGKAIGPDEKITNAATAFAPSDTIFVVVNTEGSAAITKLTAKWTYDYRGQSVKVKDDDLTIAPTGPASTEFHVSKPSGWPVGHYKVEILADGTSAGTKEFDVKK